jgi:hypothetical protein
MLLNQKEKEELEQLRRYAANVINDPYERAFFNLQRLIDNTLPCSSLNVIATAVLELKRKIK